MKLRAILYLVVLFSGLSSPLKAQFFRLAESNTSYFLFSEQEIFIEQAFKYDLLVKQVVLSDDSELSLETLEARADIVKNKLTDGFNPSAFDALFAENSLGNDVLEIRNTYFYLNADSTVDYLLQTRILFQGTDVEKEKFGPKVMDIQVLSGDDILRPGQATLHQAFYPKLDPELEAMAAMMDSPPPPPPVERTVLNSETLLAERSIDANLSLDLPVAFKKGSNIIDNNDRRMLFGGAGPSLLIEPLSATDLQMHADRDILTRFIDGITVHKEESFKRNGLNIKLLEATFIGGESAWTKLIVQRKNTLYALTLIYPESERASGAALREKMINSIRIK